MRAAGKEHVLGIIDAGGGIAQFGTHRVRLILVVVRHTVVAGWNTACTLAAEGAPEKARCVAGEIARRACRHTVPAPPAAAGAGIVMATGMAINVVIVLKATGSGPGNPGKYTAVTRPP